MKYFFQIISLFILFSAYSCKNSTGPSSAPSDKDKKGKEVSIDCPLMKQGVNMDSLKPFAETEKYIEFLDRKDRETWQKPETVIESLNLKGTETIADVGAGSGYFSFRFASKLKDGRVLAIDIDPEMVRHIHHKVMSESIKNVQAILSTPDDPKIQEKADIVFICDVLHHLKNRSEWLAKLSSELNKGTKLILIEFKEGNLPQGPPESIKIPAKEMITLVSGAGFDLIKKDTVMLPYQNYFEFTKQ
jgi:arsenite methyltransferase